MHAETTAAEAQGRNEFRVPVRLHAAMQLGESSVRVVVRDLSMRGLSIAVDRARLELAEEGDRITRGRRVIVRVPTRDAALTLAGRIAWTNLVSLDRGDVVVAGITLEELPAETLSELRAWIFRGLAAVRGAARHVMDGRWERAATELAEIGFESPTRAVLSGVLRYAANGRCHAY